jgi:superfamily II DNA or RNA helicase
MAKQLRDYQQVAFDEIMAHCFRCWRQQSPRHVLLEASVGAGKTLIIAALAKYINSKIGNKGGAVLALADQAELVDQNSQEAWAFGLNNSVYANSLNSKSTVYPVIYGMRQTLINALGSDPFDSMRVAVMLVDECHKWDFEREGSQAQIVYRHFAAINPNMIVIGVTGTPYRGVDDITGDGRFFSVKTSTSISTKYLQSESWLVQEHYGLHSHDEEIDFSSLQMRDNNETGGNYSEDEIDAIYQGAAERTFAICHEIVRNTGAPDELGVLIFCGSKFHTTQVKYGLEMAGVSSESIAIVTDDTSDRDRKAARLDAISGKVKYFLNVAVASTGWNVPRWRHVVYMRPVGSLVFFRQSVGRALRPYLTPEGSATFNAPETTAEQREMILKASEKPCAYIHDYAGVYERLAPYLDDDNEAAKAAANKAKKDGVTILCPRCGFENSEHAKRCANVFDDGNRCLHFWESVVCPNENCTDEEGERTQNSPMSQHCRICLALLKDPNAALLNKSYSEHHFRPVASMELKLSKAGNGITVTYNLLQPDSKLGTPQIYYHLDQSKWARGAWYNGFLRTHCHKDWRSRFQMMSAPAIVQQAAVFDTPTHITVRKNDKGKFIVAKARFRSGREEMEQNDEL